MLINRSLSSCVLTNKTIQMKFFDPSGAVVPVTSRARAPIAVVVKPGVTQRVDFDYGANGCPYLLGAEWSDGQGCFAVTTLQISISGGRPVRLSVDVFASKGPELVASSR